MTKLVKVDWWVLNGSRRLRIWWISSILASSETFSPLLFSCAGSPSRRDATALQRASPARFCAWEEVSCSSGTPISSVSSGDRRLIGPLPPDCPTNVEDAESRRGRSDRESVPLAVPTGQPLP